MIVTRREVEAVIENKEEDAVRVEIVEAEAEIEMIEEIEKEVKKASIDDVKMTVMMTIMAIRGKSERVRHVK